MSESRTLKSDENLNDTSHQGSGSKSVTQSQMSGRTTDTAAAAAVAADDDDVSSVSILGMSAVNCHSLS